MPAELTKEERRAQKKLKKLQKAQKKAAEAEGEATKAPSASKSDKTSKKDKKDKKRKQVEDPVAAPVKKAKTSSGAWSYTECPELSALPESTVSKFLSDNNISMTGSKGSLRPILEFAHVDFPSDLAKALTEFKRPTAIQSVSWPPVLSGQDFIGIAATGSGKTLSFGLPALIHVRNQLLAKGSLFQPRVLVLSPTRELAMQIYDTFEKFGSPLGINTVCLYGGVPKYEQRNALKSGVQVIVATPGRLLDLIQEDGTVCDLSAVDFFVLDEADRMLDLGFANDIRNIASNLQKKRQTVMFSATWPTSIQNLAAQYLSNPVHVTVGSVDLSANQNITQIVEVLEPMGKDRRLSDLLRKYHKSRKNRILVFALYKKEASRLEENLRRQGFNVIGIHGDKSQKERSDAIQAFKDGSCPLMVATDVAARGLDIENVEYVINYTYPLTTEEYCHRIGRTGRAGKTGVSHTFFTLHDKAHSGALINVLKQAKQKVPEDLLQFGTTVKKKLDPNYGAFGPKDGIDMNAKPTKIKFD